MTPVRAVNAVASRDEELRIPPFLTVQTNSRRHPGQIKLHIVVGFRSAAIKAWMEQALTPGSTVISDGLACFNTVVEVGCSMSLKEKWQPA
jgi:hypothetical protein